MKSQYIVAIFRYVCNIYIWVWVSYYKCNVNGSVCCYNISVCTCVNYQDKRSEITKLYLHIYMHVYVCKVNSSRVCVCLLTEIVYIYICGRRC